MKSRYPRASLAEYKFVFINLGPKAVKDEQAHGPDSVSSHNYPHINYETASGNKGTVRVQADQ